MYYKVMKNEKVVDVLDNLIYLKWQDKNKTMVLCGIDEAQAILSSDKNEIWHEKSLYNVPVYADCYETVEVVPIDIFEYKQLKMLNGKTPAEIIDSFVLSLVEDNVI